MLSDYRKT